MTRTKQTTGSANGAISPRISAAETVALASSSTATTSAMTSQATGRADPNGSGASATTPQRAAKSVALRRSPVVPAALGNMTCRTDGARLVILDWVSTP